MEASQRGSESAWKRVGLEVSQLGSKTAWKQDAAERASIKLNPGGKEDQWLERRRKKVEQKDLRHLSCWKGMAEEKTKISDHLP